MEIPKLADKVLEKLFQDYSDKQDQPLNQIHLISQMARMDSMLVKKLMVVLKYLDDLGYIELTDLGGTDRGQFLKIRITAQGINYISSRQKKELKQEKPISEQEKSLDDFWNLFHPEILEVSRIKFKDGHYADAVESAFKKINAIVKQNYFNSTKQELDGRDLMFKAFSLNNPVIKLSALSSQTDRNIQEGYMYLFAGSMQAIRNPHAHDNIPIEKEIAIHLIFLASLLMWKLVPAIS